MTLAALLQLVLTGGIALVGAYAGVRAGLAEVRALAIAANRSASKAHERIDALLLHDRTTTRR